MFLKSIEIKGFKSFADKTEIIFKNGITSIVGPNGSGKSNISDAVRWVLGEQSIKTLRGGKMEDVIFAGTQYRKPVGLSQVSLVLDNSDMKLPLEFSDVTISRRLYRSGDSDYLINNTSCRLKDIHELFMDTGIGREGYSIIGQGKIEAILSGRQEDRRGLLEEAAGIVKFRFRKEEAEKKLYNTEQNLVRINDILDTFLERLDPLKLDAEKAERFIELSDKLKIKELNILVTLIDDNQKVIDNLVKRLKLLEDETSSLRLQESTLKVKQGELSSEIEKIDVSLSDGSKDIYETKSILNNLEADNNLTLEKMNNLNSYIEKADREALELDLKLNKINQSATGYQELLKAKNDESSLLEAQINNLEEQITQAEGYTVEKSSKLTILKNNQINIIQQISDMKNKLSLTENNLNIHKSSIELAEKSMRDFEDSIIANTKAKSELLNEINNNNILAVELENKIKENQNNAVKLNSHIQEKDIELKKLNQLQNKLEANRNMLVNMDKRHEGYNKAVKALFQDISEGRLKLAAGSCFLLGDVIEVPKEFETALETALGSSISDVITVNEEVAKRSIDYLKTNNLGRATFLPLSIIKPKKASGLKELADISGYLGEAGSLIKYDSRFENAISYLLGRTLISADMDSALKIAKKTAYSYKIVTLTGEVINASGSMTGGSTYHKSTNVIGRKREIEELTQKLSDTIRDIESLELDLHNSRIRVKELNDKNSEYREEIHNRKIEITRLKGKVSALDLDISRMEQRSASSRNEINKLTEGIKEENSKIDGYNLEIERLNCLRQDEELEIKNLEAYISEKEDSVKLQKDELTESKIKRAQLDEIIQNCIENLNRLNDETAGVNGRKSEISSERENAFITLAQCTETINKNSILIKEKNQLIESVNNTINSLNLDKLKIKEKLKLNQEECEDIKASLYKKENDLHRLEVSRGKYETEENIHLARLNDEMGLTYEQAAVYKSEIRDMNSFKNEIALLKAEIAALGTVNPGSIQEYRELTDKISFMETQREDLNNSKEELNHLILTMTEKMREVFRENFVVLRKLFNETFQELFKGGSADLLIAEGDELQGTIDIEVQPPGKKLQNINLLSGGEKGLSAIALLFAILKMKPTPFCILDEIEAALDDANVTRYAEFLKKFSKDIQFIVITHRKGTMEVSDALYGVTMEEKGVSKIVSVDFSKRRD